MVDVVDHGDGSEIVPSEPVGSAEYEDVQMASVEADGDDGSLMSTDTSIASSLIRGHIENGRRYATLRENYWSPSDEQQWETEDLGHYVYLLLESGRDNLLFRSPITDPKHILDIGTGSGTWAIDCADKFPETKVHGIDLYPPPQTWVPENCQLEVEDATQDWIWPQKFSLIHMRYLLGSFTDPEWDQLYKRCYDNLEPGGWIEQLEPDARVMSDDGTLPPDSGIARWGDLFIQCAEKGGRSLLTQTTMKTAIERAGFIHVQEELFKTPIGSWPKDPRLKEAGRINFTHWTSGLEGYATFLLTKFGSPQPWTIEQVTEYVDQVRSEFKTPGKHIWHYGRRVWAQKPA